MESVNFKRERLDVFGSLAEFREELRKAEARGRFKLTRLRLKKDKKWYGGTYCQASDFLDHGDTTFVEKASKLAAQIVEAVCGDELAPAYVPSVVGMAPIVPAYLAGEPESMLTIANSAPQRKTVNIFVSTTISAKASTTRMKMNGTLLLALMQVLSRTCDCNAILFSETDVNAIAFPLSSPFIVSEIGAWLSQPIMTRFWEYGYSESFGHTGAWADWAPSVNSDKVFREKMMKPGDLLLLSQKMPDWSEYDTEPAKRWIKERMKEVRGEGM